MAGKKEDAEVRVAFEGEKKRTKKNGEKVEETALLGMEVNMIA